MNVEEQGEPIEGKPTVSTAEMLKSGRPDTHIMDPEEHEEPMEEQTPEDTHIMYPEENGEPTKEHGPEDKHIIDPEVHKEPREIVATFSEEKMEENGSADTHIMDPEEHEEPMEEQTPEDKHTMDPEVHKEPREIVATFSEEKMEENGSADIRTIDVREQNEPRERADAINADETEEHSPEDIRTKNVREQNEPRERVDAINADETEEHSPEGLQRMDPEEEKESMERMNVPETEDICPLARSSPSGSLIFSLTIPSSEVPKIDIYVGSESRTNPGKRKIYIFLRKSGVPIPRELNTCYYTRASIHTSRKHKRKHPKTDQHLKKKTPRITRPSHSRASSSNVSSIPVVDLTSVDDVIPKETTVINISSDEEEIVVDSPVRNSEPVFDPRVPGNAIEQVSLAWRHYLERMCGMPFPQGPPANLYYDHVSSVSGHQHHKRVNPSSAIGHGQVRPPAFFHYGKVGSSQYLGHEQVGSSGVHPDGHRDRKVDPTAVIGHEHVLPLMVPDQEQVELPPHHEHVDRSQPLDREQVSTSLVTGHEQGNPPAVLDHEQLCTSHFDEAVNHPTPHEEPAVFPPIHDEEPVCDDESVMD